MKLIFFILTMLVLTKITLDIYIISNHTPKTEETIKSKLSIILTLFYITILTALYFTVSFNINSFTGILEIILLLNIILLILLINKIGTRILMSINTSIAHLFSIVNKYIKNFTVTFNNALLIDKHLKLTLTSVNYNKNLRCYEFNFQNNNLLDRKNLLIAIFNSLQNISEYKSLDKKYIVTTIHKDHSEFFLHRITMISNETTISEFIDSIKYNITEFYESGYVLDTHINITVKMWNIYKPGSKNQK